MIGRKTRYLHEAGRQAAIIGAATVLAAQPAFAQDSATLGVTSAAVAEEHGLGEIVVTAQRRRENLQDVPVSVSAVSGDTLAASGVSATIALSAAVPAVQLTRSGPGAQFFIRGVGNTSGSTGEEGANAFYIDGVYLTDQNQVNIEFNNIERIEVLKGPQGTLFGRNSSGGLVNVITRDPGQETEIEGRVGFGNYETYHGQLYVATPLSPTLSLGIALTGRDQKKGWGKNLFTGKDTAEGWQYGVRGKLVWRPSETVKVTAAGDYTRLYDTFTSGFNLRRGAVAVGGFTYNGDYNTNTPDPYYAAVRYGGGSLTAEIDMGWATATNILAYREMRSASALDSDQTPNPGARTLVPSKGNSLQEELRLASNATDPVSWQVGIFALRSFTKLIREEIRGTNTGGINSGFDIVSSQRTQSFAGFGELTWAVTPTTHITGGLRYTVEDRQYRGVQIPVNLAIGSTEYNRFNVPEKQDSLSYNKLTYRAAIKQDVTDDINVYASYNRGFKSGGYALTSSPTNPPTRPQTTDAFEIGLKSELFDRTVRFNAAAFHYDIKDYQTRSPGQFGATTVLLNATSVKINGVEADIEIAPTEGLRITANAVYTNSKFGDFPRNPFTYPRPAICTSETTDPPGRSTGPATGGNLTCFGSAKGKRAPLAPEFTGNVGLTYTAPVGDGKLTATALYAYNSGYYFEPDNRLHQGAFSLLNASIEYRPAEQWGIEFWANNITDTHYYASSAGGSSADQGVLAAPRTYGINLTFDF